MQVFYTPLADAYLAAMSTLLAFSGLLGMVLARHYRDDGSRRLVRAGGRGVLLLAVAMWLAVYSVPEAGARFYVALVAGVSLLAEASMIQALLLTRRPRRLLLSLMAATLALSAAFAYWQWLRLGGSGPALLTAAAGFVKLSLFLTALWLCFFLPVITPGGRRMRAAWYLLALYMLLMLLSPYPSLPGPAAAQPQWWNGFFLVVYQLRLAAALGAAVLVWRGYASITDMGNKTRRLLAAMLLVLALASVFVVSVDHQRYFSLMRSNLVAEAGNVAALMEPRLLEEIADADADAGAPALRDRFFRLARRLEYQVGYRRVAAQIAALASRGDAAPLLVRDEDSLLAPEPGSALLYGWRLMLARNQPVTTDLDTPSTQNRVYSLHPLRDGEGGVIGAAVLHVPAASLAAEVFRHRRPLVLALPLMVVGLVLLLGRQRAVWQRAYAAGRDEALKLGALGHDLVGVCIIGPGGVITEVNQRLCDIAQSRRELLVGRPMHEAFPAAPSSTGPTPEQILNGLRVYGRLHYEAELLLSGGGTVYIVALVRRLEGRPGPGESVWECVDITPQKEMELQLRRQLESCRTGAASATGLDRR